MRGLALGGVAALVIGLSLACGGEVWNEALAKATTEKANELRGQLMGVADGPERQRLDRRFVRSGW